MKIVRHNNSKEVYLRDLRCGDVFELEETLYMKVYEADMDNYCDNCGDYVTLNVNNCYGVDLEDGGLYAFSPCEEVRKIECEVIEK